MKPCPTTFRPGCSCSVSGLEPSEDCYVHGWPDVRQCPYCGQFRGVRACKRCGCVYGLSLPPTPQPGEAAA